MSIILRAGGLGIITGLLVPAWVPAAEPVPPGLPPLVRLLGRVNDPEIHRDILRGMTEALAGRREVAMPGDWPAVYRKLAQSPDAEVREKALLLAVQFGDAQALDALRKTLADAKADPAARRKALQALIYKKKPDLVPQLHSLLADQAMRGPALRGLAAFDNEATPAVILGQYAKLTDTEKADAIQTLTSRPAFALALLDAIEKDRVPRRDLSAFTVRQMHGLGDKRVTERLNQVWGVIRPASAEKTSLSARYKKQLAPAFLKDADRSRGRLLYARNCAACHALFGEGGKIGPELTGSQRANLDYVLENLLDPSALVPREYQVTIVQTLDGRVVTGIVTEENPQVVTVQTQNELLRIPSAEIEERTRSPLSMMPEGVLATLKDDEVRDLIAYLASSTQVPLPEGVHVDPGPKK
jgi:putative heme-binding domain-containing protein